MRAAIVTVSERGQVEFEAYCQGLYEDGYILSSSSCGFVNSESYDFCDSWQAIFVDATPQTN